MLFELCVSKPMEVISNSLFTFLLVGAIGW